MPTNIFVMHTPSSIKSIQRIYDLGLSSIPDTAGVYAFWWIGKKEWLLESNRIVVLKGPNENRVTVEYRDWWPEELKYPCLYIGKTTNLRKRFGLHIKNGTVSRLHEPHENHHKVQPKTSSCQLRWGIEHIFPSEKSPLNIIRDAVGFSYRNDFSDNAIAERFFEEDRLVGAWRPWFNIDSER